MDKIKLTYLGQCGFSLEADGVTIVTDPYLSDGVDRRHYCAATPWKRVYPAPTTLAAVAPDAVLISHSHDDHMDPDTLGPYLASGGRAAIAAPAPECGLLRELRAPVVIEARAERSFSIGGVTITPIPCAHTELHTDCCGRFRELSYIIDFGGGRTVFFGGDMSLYDGLTERLIRARPSLLLLPANGRDAARDAAGIVGNTTADEAASLASLLGAPFIPMHHDLYAINGCPLAEIESAAARRGAKLLTPELMRPTEL